MRILLLAAAFAATAPVVSNAATADLPRPSKVPGGVYITPLGGTSASPPVVTYDGKRAMVLKSGTRWLAIVGIPLSMAPGPAHIQVQSGDSPESAVPFTVTNKQYAVQSLKVAPSKVDLSPEDAARAEKDAQRISAALATYSDEQPATLRLLQPVPGTRSSSYSTMSRAIRTAAWISLLQPARRSRPRPTAPSSRLEISSSPAIP
jgi:hypothetical protein